VNSIKALLIVLMFFGLIEAKEIKYRMDIVSYHYNSIWKRQFNSDMFITYVDDKNEFNFYFPDAMGQEGFTLSRTQADLFIKAIDKYKKWNIKASKKKVELEKTIQDINNVDIFWTLGDDWNFGVARYMNISFLSQSTQHHQLCLSFPKAYNKYEDYGSHKLETIYFNYKEAVKLREALTTKAIKSFLVKAKKKAKIEAEFN